MSDVPIPAAWKKFYDKQKEFETLPLENWKEKHLLCYTLDRFQQVFNRQYILSFKTAPSKCTELILIRKIFGVFSASSSSPQTVKNYIDWVFDKKLIPKNTQIRSFAIFLNSTVLNEYAEYLNKKNQINRATELPQEYKQVAETLNLPVFTFGDLAFVKLSIEQDPDNIEKAPYKQLLQTLTVMGFETKLLNNI